MSRSYHGSLRSGRRRRETVCSRLVFVVAEGLVCGGWKLLLELGSVIRRWLRGRLPRCDGALLSRGVDPTAPTDLSHHPVTYCPHDVAGPSASGTRGSAAAIVALDGRPRGYLGLSGRCIEHMGCSSCGGGSGSVRMEQQCFLRGDVRATLLLSPPLLLFSLCLSFFLS